MKYLRDATYVVGGYVVRGGRVLLLWHGGLSRWVPTGGRIELASGEYPHEALIREVREETGLAVRVASAEGLEVRDEAATPLPMPISIQEIRISPSEEYLDFVYFATSSTVRSRSTTEPPGLITGSARKISSGSP